MLYKHVLTQAWYLPFQMPGKTQLSCPLPLCLGLCSEEIVLIRIRELSWQKTKNKDIPFP